MSTFFLGIVIFLIILAVFDLIVGVSNDAVNFLNSAIGAKVASFKTIVTIASIGIFVGAALSNGMMDVARHGIMMPRYYSFFDVMCVFLSVVVTNVILLDIFNTLGKPTSTTVSLVFGLLGGAFGIALIKIIGGATDEHGTALSLGDLLNTEKALSVIFGIFLSVAIAFILGTIVQWIARMIFSFTYRVNGISTGIDSIKSQKSTNIISSSLKIGIFAGIAVTSIIWFLLIVGLKNSTIMTPELKTLIDENAWLILGGCLAVFSFIMTVLSALKCSVLKFVVLLGTFALAMAFTGNDLVNFIGVPLTGLDAYNDFATHSSGEASEYMMTSLMESAKTPMIYLVIAGVVMIFALIFSKKAQNVVKTSVDLSRQDEGDEMFGSSALARLIVRTSQKTASNVSFIIPKKISNWVDSRFNSDQAVLADGAAFDLIRAAVNLVLAGLLVAIGTSMKLPLSTTYVTFMVAMGSSLADRAWSRESAVFRITGVLSVIGGWFITAGAAFILAYIVTSFMYFGSAVAMVLAIALSLFLLVKSNMQFSSKSKESEEDLIFKELLRSQDKNERWNLLKKHVKLCNDNQMKFAADCFQRISHAFLDEDYSPLRHATHEIETARKQLKRQRRREIIGMRKIDPILAMEKNTWYFIANGAVEQILYCLKRINDPSREHVGNNFTPVSEEYTTSFKKLLIEVETLFNDIIKGEQSATELREKGDELKTKLSNYRQEVIDSIQKHSVNIETTTVFLNLIQETQRLIGCLRHLLRGMEKFMA